MPKAAAPGTGGDARRPVATGDARFYDKMPPLQQALFNISATEKAARRSFLLLMTTPLTAA